MSIQHPKIIVLQVIEYNLYKVAGCMYPEQHSPILDIIIGYGP